MIPVLYAYPTYANNFTKNGMHLTDAIECTVEEEINGIYQLHLVYPVDGKYATKLKALNVIVATHSYGKVLQPFDIFRVSMPKHNRIEVDARHVSYRLNKHVVKPFGGTYSLPSDLFSAIESNSVEAVYNFTYQSSITRACYLTVGEPMSIRKALSLVTVREQDGTVYTPEYTWDKFNVVMSKQRGSDRGFSIKYGKNLTDYKQEQNNEEVATGVLPYWKGKDSNKNDVVVVGYLKRIPNAANLPYQRTIAVDFTSEFDEKPSAASLGYKAEDYLNQTNISTPKASLDISFVILSQTQEYEKFASLYRVELGDTVTIEYSKVGVSAQARVIRTVYDVLKDRYKEISLGDAKIRGQSAQSAVAPVKKEVTQINSAVNALTENEASRVTLPSNFTNHGEARNFYYRKGNICMVGLDCTPSAHVSGQTLFTLPTSCRPVANLRYSVLPGVSRSSDDGGDHYVIINTDGTVTYTGTGRVFNTFTYICNGG